MSKPVILSHEPAFGELDRFRPDQQMRFGPDYIPGYTERVMANDIAKADPLLFREAHRTSKGAKTQEELYREIGAEPGPLPVELTWLRVSSPSGGNSYSADVKMAEATQQHGFRKATVDDLKLYGFGFPPAAHKEPDGTIRRLDVALYIRHGEVARWWEKHMADEAANAERATRKTELVADGWDEREGRSLSGARATASVVEEQRETITVKEKR